MDDIITLVVVEEVIGISGGSITKWWLVIIRDN